MTFPVEPALQPHQAHLVQRWTAAFPGRGLYAVNAECSEWSESRRAAHAFPNAAAARNAVNDLGRYDPRDPSYVDYSIWRTHRVIRA